MTKITINNVIVITNYRDSAVRNNGPVIFLFSFIFFVLIAAW